MRRVTLLLSAVALAACGHADLSADQQARRAKADYLWRQVANWSYSPKLVTHFIAEHERLAIGPEWWYSLCNAKYASGLNPRMSCRGGGMWARGLMDCTQLNAPRKAFADLGTCDLFDPRVSIRNHCIEASNYHRQSGREGWALQRMIFLPRAPDSRRARREETRWRRVEKRHLQLLKGYYLDCQQRPRAGKLGR